MADAGQYASTCAHLRRSAGENLCVARRGQKSCRACGCGKEDREVAEGILGLYSALDLQRSEGDGTGRQGGSRVGQSKID